MIFAATTEDGVILIDVLANDLGGAAKTLYSLDQSNPLHVAMTALSRVRRDDHDGRRQGPLRSNRFRAVAVARGRADGRRIHLPTRSGWRNGTLSLATVQVIVNGAAEPIVNHAPLLMTPIADQSFAEDGAINFILPANTFTDADHDTLIYTATLMGGDALPSWLQFRCHDPNLFRRTAAGLQRLVRYPCDGKRRQPCRRRMISAS